MSLFQIRFIPRFHIFRVFILWKTIKIVSIELVGEVFRAFEHWKIIKIASIELVGGAGLVAGPQQILPASGGGCGLQFCAGQDDGRYWAGRPTYRCGLRGGACSSS